MSKRKRVNHNYNAVQYREVHRLLLDKRDCYSVTKFLESIDRTTKKLREILMANREESKSTLEPRVYMMYNFTYKDFVDWCGVHIHVREERDLFLFGRRIAYDNVRSRLLGDSIDYHPKLRGANQIIDMIDFLDLNYTVGVKKATITDDHWISLPGGLAFRYERTPYGRTKHLRTHRWYKAKIIAVNRTHYFVVITFTRKVQVPENYSHLKTLGIVLEENAPEFAMIGSKETGEVLYRVGHPEDLQELGTYITEYMTSPHSAQLSADVAYRYGTLNDLDVGMLYTAVFREEVNKSKLRNAIYAFIEQVILTSADFELYRIDRISGNSLYAYRLITDRLREYVNWVNDQEGVLLDWVLIDLYKDQPEQKKIRPIGEFTVRKHKRDDQSPLRDRGLSQSTANEVMTFFKTLLKKSKT